jgi:SAM-dependent methyltransferase
MAGELMYGELASWFPLLTAPSEYDVEAKALSERLERYARRPVKRVLELGSGGGHNASHLKVRYEMTLTDLSEEMLAQSRTLNPECRHVQGDMRTLRLGERFDAVVVHDSIQYMTTERDLAQAIATAYEHLEPGGAAIFAPDEVAENFTPRTSCGGHDGEERSMRYLEWIHDLEPGATTFTVTYVYTLRDTDGSMRVEHEDHVVGCYPSATWRRLLGEAGFDAHEIRDPGQVEYAEVMFVGVRPER